MGVDKELNEPLAANDMEAGRARATSDSGGSDYDPDKVTYNRTSRVRVPLPSFSIAPPGPLGACRRGEVGMGVGGVYRTNYCVAPTDTSPPGWCRVLAGDE